MSESDKRFLDYGYLNIESLNSLRRIHGCLSNAICYIDNSFFRKNKIEYNIIESKNFISWFTYRKEEYGFVVTEIFKNIEDVPYNLLVKYSSDMIDFLMTNDIPYLDYYATTLLNEMLYNLNSKDLAAIEGKINLEKYWLDPNSNIPEWVNIYSKIILSEQKYNNFVKERNKINLDIKQKKQEELKKAIQEREKELEERKIKIRKKLEGTDIWFQLDSWGRILYYHTKQYGAWLQHSYVEQVIRNK